MSREDFEGVACMAEVKREYFEGQRIEYAMKKLLDAGWVIVDRNDGHSFFVRSPLGRKFHFWPYTGWFNRIGKKGPGFNQRFWQGRGIKNLILAGTFEEKVGPPANREAGGP